MNDKTCLRAIQMGILIVIALIILTLLVTGFLIEV